MSWEQMAAAVPQLPYPETPYVKWLFHQEKATFRNCKNGYTTVEPI